MSSKPDPVSIEIKADTSDFLAKLAEAQKVIREFEDALERVRRAVALERDEIVALRREFAALAEQADQNEPGDADTSRAPTTRE